MNWLKKFPKPSSRNNSGKDNSSPNTQGHNDHSSHSACSPSGNQGSQNFEKKKPYTINRPFRRAPSQGKPYLGGGGGDDQRFTPGQKCNKQPLQAPNRDYTRETEVSLLFTHSPSPLPFAYISLENIPTGREAKVLPPELGTLNIRPVDPTHRKGLLTRTNRESQTVETAFPSSLESQSACPCRGRDYQPFRQESHSERPSPQETLLQWKRKGKGNAQ